MKYSTIDDVRNMTEYGDVIRVTVDGTIFLQCYFDAPTVAIVQGGRVVTLVNNDTEQEHDPKEWVPVLVDGDGPVLYGPIDDRLAAEIQDSPGYWTRVPADHYEPDTDAVTDGYVLLYRET